MVDIAEFTAKKAALETQRAKMQAETIAFNTLHADFVKEIDKVGKELNIPVGSHKTVVVTLDNKLKLAIFSQPKPDVFELAWEDPVTGVS